MVDVFSGLKLKVEYCGFLMGFLVGRSSGRVTHLQFAIYTIFFS